MTGQSLKKRADTMLVELFRSLFEEVDTDKLREEIDQLRRSVPGFDPRDQAEILIRRTALRCGATGAMTGLPSGLMAVAFLGADLAYLVYQQFRLILGIAVIYGHEPSHRERFGESVACFAYGSGIGLGKTGIAVALETVAAETGMVAEKIGTRFLRDRVARVVPILGAITGGALNYFTIRAIGRATIRYYESLIDPQLADEIWLDGDREHA